MSKQAANEQKMCGRGHRQEFGDPLHDAKQRGS